MNCLKKKSYDLKHESEANTGETKSFPTKYLRRIWVKYLVITLLIGFSLWLVLSNVDFVDNAKQATTTIATTKYSTNNDLATYNSNSKTTMADEMYAEVESPGLTKESTSLGTTPPPSTPMATTYNTTNIIMTSVTKPRTTSTTVSLINSTTHRSPISNTTTSFPPQNTTILPEYQDCFLPLPTILSCINSTLTCDYNGNFSVKIISQTSVRLEIGYYKKALKIIYFAAMKFDATFLGQIESSSQRNTMEVSRLKSNESYTFCLIQYYNLKTSPFDCRSAYLPIVEVERSWLKSNDKTLFYVLVVWITVTCVIIGVAVVYCLVCCRPTLLCGVNKRLQRVASASHEVLLFTKDQRRSKVKASEQFALNEISLKRTSGNYSGNDSVIKTQYFKQSDFNGRGHMSHSSPYNHPPTRWAPKPPNEYLDIIGGVNGDEGGMHSKDLKGVSPIPIVHTSWQGTRIQNRPQNDVFSVDYERENIYESLDLYQKMY